MLRTDKKRNCIIENAVRCILLVIICLDKAATIPKET